jgi:hypothetical protein
MTRTMRDSINPSAIPLAGTDIAAGYANGTYANLPALAARFPHIPRVSIDVRGDLAEADVRDWETGDKGGSLEQWVIDHNRASGHKDAVVYCNRDTIPEVRQLTGSQLLAVDYWLWIATLDGTIVMPGPDHLGSPPYTYPGVIACQDRNTAQPSPGYDTSLVFADWWKPALAPPPVRLLSATVVAKYSDGSVRTGSY